MGAEKQPLTDRELLMMAALRGVVKGLKADEGNWSHTIQLLETVISQVENEIH